MLTHRSILILIFWAFSVVASARDGRNCQAKANVKVESSTASSFITLDIQHCRRIGKVTIEVRDADGRVLYREEGKAMTGTLVRRLDKGAFPKSGSMLTVTTRDFRIEQALNLR